MDIWEANQVSAAYTPHPCSVSGQTRCSGEDCAINSRYDGLCDPDGCDFNSFRMGDTTFYGEGKTVDTSKKFTVVTQFLTNNNSTTGTLSEIRRLYVQNGQVFQNSKVNIPGMTAYDSITDQFCSDQKTTFGDTNNFATKGGLAAMGKAMANGMVLVMSVWDDHAASMLWLDSAYPTTADATKPGIKRGTCATTSGVPTDIETSEANASVTFSNIRFGAIGSTYTGAAANPPPPTGPTNPGTTSTPSSTAGAPAATQTKYGQWYVGIMESLLCMLNYSYS